MRMPKCVRPLCDNRVTQPDYIYCPQCWYEIRPPSSGVIAHGPKKRKPNCWGCGKFFSIADLSHVLCHACWEILSTKQPRAA